MALPKPRFSIRRLQGADRVVDKYPFRGVFVLATSMTGRHRHALDDVYRKFGEVSEAAQLLETELGTLLLKTRCIKAGLVESPDSEKAAQIYRQVNGHTLGQLIQKLRHSVESIADLEELLAEALTVRNRLAHSFYPRHNFRRNSDDGRAVMMQDLESMHDKLLEAYKRLLLLSGIDIEKSLAEGDDAWQPTGHLPSDRRAVRRLLLFPANRSTVPITLRSAYEG